MNTIIFLALGLFPSEDADFKIWVKHKTVQEACKEVSTLKNYPQVILKVEYTGYASPEVCCDEKYRNFSALIALCKKGSVAWSCDPPDFHVSMLRCKPSPSYSGEDARTFE